MSDDDAFCEIDDGDEADAHALAAQIDQQATAGLSSLLAELG